MQEPIADPFDLKLALLPRRALVAFAVRCAWRVSPLLSELPENDRTLIEDAIRAAERFAAGSQVRHSDIDAAYQSVSTLSKGLEYRPPAPGSLRKATLRSASKGDDGTAWMASLVCARACGIASLASHGRVANQEIPTVLPSLMVLMCRTIIRTAQQDVENDIDILMSLNLGQAGTLGEPVDTGEAGPLGFLWPDGEPDWSECRFGR